MRYHHVPLDYPYTTVGIVLPIKVNDNSGIAHILEHVLLCGSQKYPYNDLFFTTRANHIVNDINAATFANRIILHATAWSQQELDSIIDIYSSIIHAPLLKRVDFEREGVRHSDSGINGIVYNEMFSAAQADPNFYPFQSAYAALFKDSRRFNANGDPQEIVDNSYEDMPRFWDANCYQEECLIITVGSIYSNEAPLNDASASPTVPKQNPGVTIELGPDKKKLHAWRLGDLDDPIAYCDALSVKSLLSATDASYVIDETFGDVVLLSSLDSTKLAELSTSSNADSLQKSLSSLLKPGDQFRPCPLQWLHRLAAAYAIDRRLLTIHDWLNPIHERTSSWQDPDWRSQKIAELFQLSDLTLSCPRPALIAPSAKATIAPNEPIQPIHRRKATIDNPFELFHFRAIDSQKPSEKTAPHQRVEQDAIASSVSITNAMATADEDALYCGVFIGTPPLTIEQEATIHLLCAYWTMSALHPVIRRTYGAYGAIARYRRDHGISIITYRDPSVKKSLAFIKELIESAPSIEEERYYTLCKNEVLSQLSPRPTGDGFFVNQEPVTSEEQWHRLTGLWSRLYNLRLDEFNILLTENTLNLPKQTASAATL